MHACFAGEYSARVCLYSEAYRLLLDGPPDAFTSHLHLLWGKTSTPETYHAFHSSFDGLEGRTRTKIETTKLGSNVSQMIRLVLELYVTTG